MRRVAVCVFTPPSAMIGNVLPRAIWLARNRPSGGPLPLLRVGKIGLSVHASAPCLAARATASAECADAVMSQGASRGCNRASGQCTPCAPTRWASSGSAAISRTHPRERQTLANRRAVEARSDAPKCRKTMAVPRGRRFASATGSGVRSGSVKKKSDGMGGPPASRLSRRASAASC